MKAIVKVQLPFASSRPELHMLVYAKNRRYMVEQKIDAATLKAMGNDLKAFFEGEYRATTNTWLLGKRVGNRDW